MQSDRHLPGHRMRARDEPAYLVTVTPLAGRAGPSAALILFRDLAVADHSLIGRLRTLFNLTSAEAAVAIDVAHGLALPDIARNRGVRVPQMGEKLVVGAVCRWAARVQNHRAVERCQFPLTDQKAAFL